MSRHCALSVQGHNFLLKGTNKDRAPEYTLMSQLHSDDEGSQAHDVVWDFLTDWLEPFVHAYACIVLDNDARREHLPQLFQGRAMPDRQRSNLCRMFSYLGRQHADFSNAGKWAEWIVPAIAVLQKFGSRKYTPQITQFVTAFFEQLCRLAAYWQFCTTDEHWTSRRPAAQLITRKVFDTGCKHSAVDCTWCATE